MTALLTFSSRLIRLLPVAFLAFAASSAHAGTALDLAGFRTTLPNGWISEKPANRVRAAQFRLPGGTADAAVEAVVYHFPPGRGGTVEQNIQRWESNFVGHGGKPVRAITRKAKAGRMPVTWIEIHGAYARSVTSGVSGDTKPDQTLLVAFVETPKGSLTFQLFGPRLDVSRHRKALEGMVNGLK